MDRLTSVTDMTEGRRMLLETLAGHFALLKDSHPRKAQSNTARKAQRLIQAYLRTSGQRRRAA